MKEWSTKTATERAAAEPSLDYWSGDTSALEANIQQHWADISVAHGKTYHRKWQRFQGGQIGNYTLIIVFQITFRIFWV